MLRALVNFAKTVLPALARAARATERYLLQIFQFKFNIVAHYLRSVFLTKVPFLSLSWSLYSLCSMYLLPAFASCEGGWGEGLLSL
jgi:hypothetical protein